MNNEDGSSCVPKEEVSSNKRPNTVCSNSLIEVAERGSVTGMSSENNVSIETETGITGENLRENTVSECLNHGNADKKDRDEASDDFVVIDSNTERDGEGLKEAEKAIEMNDKKERMEDVIVEEVVVEVEEETNAENNLTIVIRPLNGRDLTVMASQNSTIRQLKELIEVQSGIEARNQRLIFRGRCMIDNETVGHYFNESGTIIHLVPYVRNDSQGVNSERVRQENPNTGNNTGMPEVGFQNFFTDFGGSVPGFSSGSAFTGGFPGAMMFGAIRLDREGGIAPETEDLVQRVLRSFGDVMSGGNSGMEGGGGIVRSEQSIGTDGEHINYSVYNIPGTMHTSRVVTLNESGVPNNTVSGAVGTSSESVVTAPDQNNRTSGDIRSSRSNASESRNTSAGGERIGARNSDIRGEHMSGNNPMGRIGTIVSRIFQAFNHPMADMTRDPVGNITVSNRRTSRNTGLESTRSNDTNLNSSGDTVSNNNSERSMSGSNGDGNGNISLGDSNSVLNRGTRERGTAEGTAGSSQRSGAGSNWNQFTAAGGIPGILPINGRPGVSVTTIPLPNLSIPVTIRTTTSSRIPTGNIPSVSGGVRTSVGAVGGGTNEGSENPLSYEYDSQNAGNREHYLNNSTNNGNDLYRQSSDNYFRSISDILEQSASQLQLVASGIREIGGIENTDSGRSNFTYLPPIPCTTSNYLISNGSFVNNGLNGTPTTEYVQHHSHRLYISNELIYRFLPWNSLNDLMNILERDSGWRRPRITIPPQPTDLYESGPLSVFISVYLQALFVVQSNLLQVQAWQERFARLDVPRLCYTVHMLTLISQISAYLASLLAWLFHNMAQHVEQDRLVDSLQWGRSSNQNEDASDSNYNSIQCGSNGDTGQKSSVENNNQEMYIDDTRANIELGQSANPTNNSENIDSSAKNEVDRGKEGVNEQNGQCLSPIPSSHSPNCNNNVEFDTIIGSNNSNRNYIPRPFSTAYSMGNMNLSNNTFGISRLIRIQTNDVNEINRGRHEPIRDMLRFLVRQTEANLNLPYTRVTAHNNLNNEYRAMFVRDLLNGVSDNPDYFNDQDRFPYIKMIFSALYQSENDARE